jgi:hypothetical protein
MMPGDLLRVLRPLAAWKTVKLNDCENYGNLVSNEIVIIIVPEVGSCYTHVLSRYGMCYINSHEHYVKIDETG